LSINGVINKNKLMKKIIVPVLFLLFTISCKKNIQDSLNDKNFIAEQTLSLGSKGGIQIPSVTICSQVWMQKNLDVTTYRNGDPIPQVTNPAEWLTLTTGAWCYYNNDPATGAVYGKLYNGYAVYDPRGLAPTGWHIPSDAEWTTLTDCLGGLTAAGGKLKERGIKHWSAPNTNATNASKFTALPGGNLVSIDGRFFNLQLTANFWTSTPFPFTTNASYQRRLNYNGENVQTFGGALHSDGMSVRCVKN
jgi:uncharacterized protein (TIGR02145 family)